MKFRILSALVLFMIISFVINGFAEDELQTKPGANEKKIEIPVFGVRIVPEYSTSELDLAGEEKTIAISYQVFINPVTFRDLELTFTCREVSKNANKIVEFAALGLPKDSQIYAFDFPVPDFETKLVFQLRLKPTKDENADPAFSQEFVCKVFSSKEVEVQTKPVVSEELEVTLDKPELKAEVKRDKLIDKDFYNINLKLNIKVKNPRLPILWSRKVECSYNKTLPEYLKNTLPSSGTSFEREVARIEALPPGQTQELQQTIKLTYIEELFPLTFSQVEKIKIGDAEYSIEIKFKIYTKKKFPPAISVRFISEGKNLQVFKLQ